MAKKRLLGLVLGATIGALFLAGGGVARAQDANGARFSVVEGRVTVHGANGAQAAASNMPLSPGDYIASGTSARAEVTFSGGSALRLAGGVQAHFIDGSQVQLADGTVEVAVSNGGGAVQIDTPSVTIRPAGAGTYRISVTSSGATQVTARRGQVDVVTPQRTYVVETGKSIVASGSAQQPSIADVNPVAYDSFDQFGSERDRALLAEAPQYGDQSYQGGNGAYDAGGYGYPQAVVVAPVWPACTYASGAYVGFGGPWFGISIGLGGYTGGCAIYPSIAFNPWWYSPWYYGWGAPYYGWGYGWGGYAWNGYSCCGGGYYYPCCGGGYYPPGHGYYRGPGWYRRPPVPIRGGVAWRENPLRPEPIPGTRAAPAPIERPMPHSPIARTPIARTPIARAPIARTPIARTPVAHAPVERRAPVVARNPRSEPVRRATPVRVAENNPWRRFDADRGTHVALAAPAALRNDPVRSNPVRSDPVRDGSPHGSASWDRFVQTRGDVSIRPEPIAHNPYAGVRDSNGGPGLHGSYGGAPERGSANGGFGNRGYPSAPTGGGGYHGSPIRTGGGSPIRTGGGSPIRTGGGAPRGGGGRPPH